MVDKAQRKLLDCLNPDREHRLSPEQVHTILRWARDAGYHDGWAALCVLTGYHPSDPVTPIDERAELQRQVKNLTKTMQELLIKFEKVQA
jgi:hypothetical protein